MIAHYHGRIWNAAEFARSLGTSEVTARRYLDILAGTYMVRLLPPWFENIGKRQVKSPRVYIRDTGILHGLLGLETLAEVQSHPRLGASWEGFAVEQIIGLLGARDAYFWSTHSGAELDLLVLLRGRRYGFEIKYADAPGASRSMHVALHDLGLIISGSCIRGSKNTPSMPGSPSCPWKRCLTWRPRCAERGAAPEQETPSLRRTLINDMYQLRNGRIEPWKSNHRKEITLK